MLNLNVLKLVEPLGSCFGVTSRLLVLDLFWILLNFLNLCFHWYDIPSKKEKKKKKINTKQTLKPNQNSKLSQTRYIIRK